MISWESMPSASPGDRHRVAGVGIAADNPLVRGDSEADGVPVAQHGGLRRRGRAGIVEGYRGAGADGGLGCIQVGGDDRGGLRGVGNGERSRNNCPGKVQVHY